MDYKNLLEVSKHFYPGVVNHSLVILKLADVEPALHQYYHEISKTIEDDVAKKFKERGYILSICGTEIGYTVESPYNELIKKSKSELNWKLCKIFDCAYDDFRYKITELSKAKDFIHDSIKLLGLKRDIDIPMEIFSGHH